MSWFNKIFGSQYDFNSQSSSQDSSQGLSQEPKVHYTKQKNETDGDDTEIENLTIREIEEFDETTQSTPDSRYSWSSVSQKIDIKDEKRELSDNEEKPWWESFKSQASQKSSQGTQKQQFYSLQSSLQTNLRGQASSSKDNKSDDEEDENDDEKISFYLKVGKYKKFKFV